jgi:DNA-binding XRE family transcriptional regulator
MFVAITLQANVNRRQQETSVDAGNAYAYSFGMSITDHIIASGKTRVAICEEAGVSRQTLHKIENGLTTPRIEVAAKVAGAIGCHLDVIRPDIAGLLS